MFNPSIESVGVGVFLFQYAPVSSFDLPFQAMLLRPPPNPKADCPCDEEARKEGSSAGSVGAWSSQVFFFESGCAWESTH